MKKHQFIQCRPSPTQAYLRHAFSDRGKPLNFCRRCRRPRSECAVATRAQWKGIRRQRLVAEGRDFTDPNFRHLRAVKAGNAARDSYRRRREALGERHPTKGAAYAAGYAAGYRTAYHWWQRQFARARVRRVA